MIVSLGLFNHVMAIGGSQDVLYGLVPGEK